MKSVDNFHPDLMKDVRVALEFDRSLKSLSPNFIGAACDDRLDSINNSANHSKNNPAFHILRKSSEDISQFPKQKDKDSPKFTSIFIYISCSVEEVSLQINYQLKKTPGL